MYDYQLTVPYEFEAFLIWIKLTIKQFNPSPKFTATETKDATIFFIQFENEDRMLSIRKQEKVCRFYLIKSYGLQVYLLQNLRCCT